MAAKTRTLGTFTATGPRNPLLIKNDDGIAAASSRDARLDGFHRFSRSEKVERGATCRLGARRGATRTDLRAQYRECARAGLTFRPLATTASDTLACQAGSPQSARRNSGGTDSRACGGSSVKMEIQIGLIDSAAPIGRGLTRWPSGQRKKCC